LLPPVLRAVCSSENSGTIDTIDNTPPGV
jgi:hypothetical protein